MTFDEFSTGVTWNPPGLNPDHSYKETLSMGYTSCSARQVTQIIEEMKAEWKGCSYNVLSRNCHSFSNTLCQRLGTASLPHWVNDLADTGARTVEFLDNADSGYDGGSALFDFLGSVGGAIADTFSGRRGSAGYATENHRSAYARHRKGGNLHGEQEDGSKRTTACEPSVDPFLVPR